MLAAHTTDTTDTHLHSHITTVFDMTRFSVIVTFLVQFSAQLAAMLVLVVTHVKPDNAVCQLQNKTK